MWLLTAKKNFYTLRFDNSRSNTDGDNSNMSSNSSNIMVFVNKVIMKVVIVIVVVIIVPVVTIVNDSNMVDEHSAGRCENFEKLYLK